MSSQIIFSETALKERLTRFSCSKMVAFAACCAERLAPVYMRYAQKASLPDHESSLFRYALDEVWNHLLGKKIDELALEQLEESCLEAIPSEDDTSTFKEPYAEDAGAAVTYCLRALRSCDPQNAIWAATSLYDALDNFVIRTEAASHIDEQKILAHPLIQEELARQQCDLDQLEASDALTEIKTFEALRTKSQLQALKILG
jgi:uncharacterized protein YjaG (DUF416 family)